MSCCMLLEFCDLRPTSVTTLETIYTFQQQQKQYLLWILWVHVNGAIVFSFRNFTVVVIIVDNADLATFLYLRDFP